MANLTSTITITGAIGGRKVDISHTYTVEDVYDAFSRHTAANAGSVGGFMSRQSDAGTYGYAQNSPNYVFMANASVSGISVIDFSLSGPVSAGIVLMPLHFCILHGINGFMDVSGVSGNTAMRDLLDLGTSTGISGFQTGIPKVFAAFFATT